MKFKSLCVFILVGFLLVFAIQNPQTVLFHFLHWRNVSTTLLVIILASVLVGMGLGFLMSWHPSPSAEDAEPEEGNPPE